MNLRQGESLFLVIHRTNADPSRCRIAVRKSETSITSNGDFELHPLQEAILELGYEADYPTALEIAIAKISEFQP